MSAHEHLVNSMTIFTEFDLERRMAHAKHGRTSMESQPAFSHRRMTILTEEVGECAKVLNDMEHTGSADQKMALMVALRGELVQVGAMVLAWIAAIDGHALPMPEPEAGDICPDCGQPHSGSPMQRPGGLSGCPTCGWCA